MNTAEIMAFLGSNPQEILCTLIVLSIPAFAALYILKIFIFDGGLQYFLKVAFELFVILCLIGAVIELVGGL